MFPILTFHPNIFYLLQIKQIPAHKISSEVMTGEICNKICFRKKKNSAFFLLGARLSGEICDNPQGRRKNKMCTFLSNWEEKGGSEEGEIGQVRTEIGERERSGRTERESLGEGKGDRKR